MCRTYMNKITTFYIIVWQKKFENITKDLNKWRDIP